MTGNISSPLTGRVSRVIGYAAVVNFENAFLGFLHDLDWRAIAGESEPKEMEQLKADFDKIASEIDRTKPGARTQSKSN